MKFSSPPSSLPASTAVIGARSSTQCYTQNNEVDQLHMYAYAKMDLLQVRVVWALDRSNTFSWAKALENKTKAE